MTIPPPPPPPRELAETVADAPKKPWSKPTIRTSMKMLEEVRAGFSVRPNHEDSSYRPS